jgi:CRP/FNR family transcriptional regulator, anaerobic regulatory protein
MKFWEKLGGGTKTASKGEILVCQGDAVSSVFLLLEGVLRVYTTSATGKEATLYLLRKGEICLLSLNAAFTNGRYPAWVSVESKTAKFALLPGSKVREQFSIEAQVQNLVLQGLTSTIHELMDHLDEVLLCNLSDRMERYLARNADPDGRVILTHQTLATHMGATREAVSRELATLKRQGRIVTGRGYVRLVK